MSAETPAAVDVAEVELVAAPADVLPAAAFELLDDEQAASRTAAPAAMTPNAARAARGLRLPILKRTGGCPPGRLPCSMRPRIKSGVYQTTMPTGLISPSEIVNRMTTEIGYRFGLYRPTSVRVGGILSPHHIASAG